MELIFFIDNANLVLSINRIKEPEATELIGPNNNGVLFLAKVPTLYSCQ